MLDSNHSYHGHITENGKHVDVSFVFGCSHSTEYMNPYAYEPELLTYKSWQDGGTQRKVVPQVLINSYRRLLELCETNKTDTATNWYKIKRRPINQLFRIEIRFF